MWAPDSGDRSPRAEDIAQRIRELRSLGESAYEDKIDFGRQLLNQVFKSGIAHQRNVVSRLFTPHRYDLRHDRGEIGIHYAGEQCSCRSLGNEVDDSDTKLSHTLKGYPPWGRWLIVDGLRVPLNTEPQVPAGKHLFSE